MVTPAALPSFSCATVYAPTGSVARSCSWASLEHRERCELSLAAPAFRVDQLLGHELIHEKSVCCGSFSTNFQPSLTHECLGRLSIEEVRVPPPVLAMTWWTDPPPSRWRRGVGAGTLRPGLTRHRRPAASPLHPAAAAEGDKRVLAKLASFRACEAAGFDTDKRQPFLHAGDGIDIIPSRRMRCPATGRRPLVLLHGWDAIATK